jgi:serine/threonine-protein kinase
MDKASTTDTPLTPRQTAPSPPAEMDLTGMTLGDFRIRRRLGRGGMGQVYLAEQISLKREVALKTLHSELAANRLSLERFDAEAKAVAKATHANIVQIYVIDRAQVQNETVHYLALEYVDGRNLRELLEKKGTPDLLMGLSIMYQVASALQRASELGIIHRDIKPENILISRQGEVKVADFGLSRCFTDPAQPHSLTQSGVTMGTPLYMAPEQVELRAVDPRTDIYSFGITCYHMWAGQPPFRGNSPFEIAAQHVQKAPAALAEIRPDLPADLCALIHRMTAKKPEDRPQTSREIVREVGRLRDMLVGVTATSSFAIKDGADIAEASAAVIAGLQTDGTSASELRRKPHTLAGAGLNWTRSLLVGLAVLLAFAIGLGGSYLYRSYPKTQSQANEEELPPTRNPLSDDSEKEKELVRMRQKHSPPKEPADVKHTLDLGIFYLEKNRLDKAESLFKELIGEKELGDVGKLGIAMVLAFRAEPSQSNKKFSEVQNRGRKDEKTLGDIANYWRSYPPWRKMMATALYHNRANLPAAFPKELERWLGQANKGAPPKE